MSKKIREKDKEFRVPRLVVTISLVALIAAYIICLVTQDFKYDSILCIVIIMAAGIFLGTLGIVIKMMDRRVDLDYDSIVVWKMCIVAGILFVGFGILCIIMRLS